MVIKPSNLNPRLFPMMFVCTIRKLSSMSVTWVECNKSTEAEPCFNQSGVMGIGNWAKAASGNSNRAAKTDFISTSLTRKLLRLDQAANVQCLLFKRCATKTDEFG